MNKFLFDIQQLIFLSIDPILKLNKNTISYWYSLLVTTNVIKTKT